MIRTMLDTNIIVAGIVFAGNERKLLNTIHLNNVTLVLADFIAEETKTVLRQNFPGKEAVFDNLLSLLPLDRTPLPPIHLIEDARLMIREPKGAVILASAMHAKPDIFVSGDLDFHTSEIKSHINVMHSKEAVALISCPRK